MAYTWLLSALALCTLASIGVQGVCFETCDRPTYCNDGDVTAIPGDCTNYYLCEFNQWMVQPCGDGSVFDLSNIGGNPHGCSCKFNSTCPYTCATIPPTTLPPGPCDDVPDPCDEGVKYADQSNCTSYYLCLNGDLEERVCALGPQHGQCNTSGLPCTFDITLGQCVHPDRDFDCETRCPSHDIRQIDLGDNEIEASLKLQVLEKQWDKLMTKQRNERKHLEDVIFDETHLLKKIYGKKPLRKSKLLRKRKSKTEITKQENKIKQNSCLEASLVCNKPTYCGGDERIASGDDCSKFYQCNYGSWQRLDCQLGYTFDMASCTCVPEDTGCTSCPVTTPNPTPIVGRCPALEDCTLDGRLIPDRVNCEVFYQCIEGEWTLQNCVAGITHDCTKAGFSCAFDPVEGKCVHPDSSFSCDDRCAAFPDSEDENEEIRELH